MRNFFSTLITKLNALERSEKNWWLGLLMLFIGLTWSESIYRALVIVGAVLAIESVITSYLAAWVNSRVE